MKICLVGNNITSLILAYILSKKKIYSEIYSVKSNKVNFKTRTLGLTENNIKFLSNYFNNISKRINQIKEIKVQIKNNEIKDEILFKQNSNTLFNMISYNDFKNYLTSRIKKNNFVSYKYLTKSSKFLNLLNDKKFSLIINCERSNPLTIKYLKKGIKKNYFSKAYTTIINHKKTLNKRAVQVFTDRGPIAYLPLSNRLTSVVFSCEIDKKKQLSENEIIEKIKFFNPNYKIISLSKIESFNLNLNLPKRYFYENLLFFGDSLHSVHPLAGQGFNMTIRDIIKLNKILEDKIDLGLSIDKSVCKEFEQVAKSYNTTFSLGIDFIYEFFSLSKSFLPKRISKNIFSFINKNPKIKNFGIKFADQGIF
tara:strand:+ start:40 stop:1137 length:1098 start_codon:yes stop_codon:yes gene_type:complete